MLPPTPALWVVSIYARLTGARIAGDLHTGVFDDPKWIWATKQTLRLLRKRGIAIVTNNALSKISESTGCKTLVLHDLIEERPVDLSNFEDASLNQLPRPFVLLPLAYAHDEPIEELLSAAASTPQISWVMTGRAPTTVRDDAPTNVIFTGYVTNADYVRLISKAAAILAITKNENTMQRAGYEALCFAQPLVTSDTRVLRDYYGGYANVVRPKSDQLAKAVVQTLGDRDAASRMRSLRTLRIEEQNEALARLRDWVKIYE